MVKRSRWKCVDLISCLASVTVRTFYGSLTIFCSCSRCLHDRSRSRRLPATLPSSPLVHFSTFRKLAGYQSSADMYRASNGRFVRDHSTCVFVRSSGPVSRNYSITIPFLVTKLSRNIVGQIFPKIHQKNRILGHCGSLPWALRGNHPVRRRAPDICPVCGSSSC